MTEAERQRLYKNFDAFNTLQDGLKDREHGTLPLACDDLLKLHELCWQS